MSAPWLTVIVLAYNNPALTARCLASLAAAWPEDWELLVVDNGSTDATGDVAERYRDRVRRLQVLRLARNQTFSAANNAAAKASAGTKLLFLNNDVETTPASLRVLAAALTSYPEAGVAGPKLLYPGGARVQHAGIRPMLWGLASNFGVGASPADPRVNQMGEVFAVTGACLCIDRGLFEALSGFDEAFHWGYEDVDLCLRARAAGRPVAYVPQSDGVHAESATIGAAHYDATRLANYQRYRARWDVRLAPMEWRYLEGLRRSRIERLVIFGDGAAGRALARVLTEAGFQVVGFAATEPRDTHCEGRALVSLDALGSLRFDRLVAGTQFFFEVEAALRAADPLGAPLFPVLD